MLLRKEFYSWVGFLVGAFALIHSAFVLVLLVMLKDVFDKLVVYHRPLTLVHFCASCSFALDHAIFQGSEFFFHFGLGKECIFMLHYAAEAVLFVIFIEDFSACSAGRGVTFCAVYWFVYGVHTRNTSRIIKVKWLFVYGQFFR